MLANGYNGNTGYIRLDSNEKIILKSKSVDIRGTESAKFFSEKTLDVIGNSIMNIYGGLMDFADGATKLRGSKCGPSSTEENAKKLKDENATAMRQQFAAEAEQAQFEADQAGGT